MITLNRMNIVTSVYVAALAILAYVLLAAATNANVVWHIESEIGHALSCTEAYYQREIDTYFYLEQRTQGDTLYFYSICAPAVLLGFVLLAGGMWLTVRRSQRSSQFKKRIYMLMGAGIVVLFGLLVYAPVISTIGCALE